MGDRAPLNAGHATGRMPTDMMTPQADAVGNGDYPPQKAAIRSAI